MTLFTSLNLFILNLILFNFVYMGVLLACMYMHYVHILPVDLQEGVGSSGLGVTDSCEPRERVGT